MKPKKIFVHIIVLFLIVVFIIIGLNRKVIFQRGNPLPYLTAASRISKEEPFYPVENSDKNTYISHRSYTSEEFIAFAESKLEAEFVSQEGSAYIFSADGKTICVTSEIYLGKYKLWDFPKA